MAFFGINLAENPAHPACCAFTAKGEPLPSGPFVTPMRPVNRACWLLSSYPRWSELFPRVLNNIFKPPSKRATRSLWMSMVCFEKPQLGERVRLLIKPVHISFRMIFLLKHFADTEGFICIIFSFKVKTNFSVYMQILPFFFLFHGPVFMSWSGWLCLMWTGRKDKQWRTSEETAVVLKWKENYISFKSDIDVTFLKIQI